MTDSRTKNAMYNVAFSIVLQIVTFIKGLILPRIIIPAYGSDVNGLVTSITQFLTYISLLEAGVGSIFRASLYKPLVRGSMDEVSGIINEQKRFYKKIGTIFIFYVITLCAVYPFIAKTNVSKPYIVSLILILSVSIFAEYFVSLPYASLLSAHQKIRISYIVAIVYSIVSIFVSLFWVCLKADIRLIYLSLSVIGLLRPVFYVTYVKKHYNLNPNAEPNELALSQRWNGLVHHFAYYVHTSTDAAVITVFISTAMVSVYNVYGAIIFGMEKIINSIATGTAAGLGNLIESESKEKLDKTVNQFELIQAGITTVLYTITALLLIPFIRIYTADMTDMDYIQPEFGFVLIAAEAIYCFRCIYSTISASANKFKETQFGAILECVLNLAISLALVTIFKMGILGVAIGTAIGMLARLIFEVLFLSKNVLYRPAIKSVKALAVSTLISAISILLCNGILNYSAITGFGTWVLHAAATSVTVGIIAFTVYLIFYKEVIKSIIYRLYRLIKR